jgi:hypothetical protein
LDAAKKTLSISLSAFIIKLLIKISPYIIINLWVQHVYKLFFINIQLC